MPSEAGVLRLWLRRAPGVAQRTQPRRRDTRPRRTHRAAALSHVRRHQPHKETLSRNRWYFVNIQSIPCCTSFAKASTLQSEACWGWLWGLNACPSPPELGGSLQLVLRLLLQTHRVSPTALLSHAGKSCPLRHLPVSLWSHGPVSPSWGLSRWCYHFPADGGLSSRPDHGHAPNAMLPRDRGQPGC